MRAPQLCAAVVAAACILTGCRKVESHERPLTPVKTQAVEMSQTSDELRYSATVEPNTQVAVAFKIGGYVESIYRVRGVDGRERDVQDGDSVRAGQVLARLRQSDYAVKHEQAVSQLGEAQSSLGTTKSQLTEAEVTYNQAQIDFERARNLLESQSATKADYDEAKTKLEASRARVDIVRGQLAAIQPRIQGAQAMLAEANIALQDTALKAPMDAVVLNREIEAGTLASPGTVAFVLADTRNMKVVFGIPDTLVPRMKPGAVLMVRTEALPERSFSGRITRISSAADAKSRVFEVEVSVPNPDNLLKTGMIASVAWSGSGIAQATPVLPLNAIVRSKSKPDGYAVFLVRNENGRQIARRQDVRLGDAFGNGIAVTSGVAAGQHVITNGSSLVSDGDPVQVVP